MLPHASRFFAVNGAMIEHLVAHIPRPSRQRLDVSKTDDHRLRAAVHGRRALIAMPLTGQILDARERFRDEGHDADLLPGRCR